MVQALIQAPRWLLLISLVFAPWAYGSTRPWAMAVLSIFLGCICLLWLVECLTVRRRPEPPGMLAAAALGLMAQGWWMVLNAHSFFDRNLNALLPKIPLVAGAPGSVDGPGSASAMCLLTGLLGVVLFCRELAQYSVWRKRIWRVMALTGFSIAAFGLAQKIGGEKILSLLWEPEKQDAASNFATFRYRGNAGAYLNLILPLVAGFCFLAFQNRPRPWQKALWSTALFVVVMAIQLNPSRAGGFIAVVLGVILVGTFCWRYGRDRQTERDPKTVMIYLTIAAAVLAAIGWISSLGHWETSWRRFDLLGFNPADRSPVEIYLRMTPDAGVMGFGPGTFASVFPSYQKTYDFGGRPFPPFWQDGLFQQAHQDYLQTLIEWGYLGSLLWSVLICGGMARGATGHFRGRTGFDWLRFCSLLALGGVFIHALIDFPLQIASIQLYVCVLLGICWGTGSRSAKEAAAKTES
jgi:hypothetical protein